MKCTNRSTVLGAALGLLLTATVACSDESSEPEPVGPGVEGDDVSPANGPSLELGSVETKRPPPPTTVAATISRYSDLATFAAAIEAAAWGPQDLTSSDARSTLFAPTDSAFEALLTSLELTRAELFARPELLRLILDYHVVEGGYASSDATAPVTLRASNGYTVFLSATDGRMVVNGGSSVEGGASTTQDDIEATNGWVHKIDRVLMPPDLDDLVRFASASGAHQLNQLQAAIESARYGAIIGVDLTTYDVETGRKYTLFAPNDEAFPDETSADQMTRLLQYHTASGAYGIAAEPVLPEFVNSIASQIYTGFGSIRAVSLSIHVDPVARVAINGGFGMGPRQFGADIVSKDYRAVNGFVHVLQGGLEPLNALEMIQVSGADFFSQAAVAGDEVVVDAEATSLVALLSRPEFAPVTVFAPTDEAVFSVFPEGWSRDSRSLAERVTQHTYLGDIPQRRQDLSSPLMTELAPLDGHDLEVIQSDGSVGLRLRVDNGSTATVQTADVGVTNGVLHFIDAPLVESVD